jgi:hypothetical protein
MSIEKSKIFKLAAATNAKKSSIKYYITITEVLDNSAIESHKKT